MYTLEGFLFNDWGIDEINPPSRRGNRNARYSKTYNNNNIFTFDTETTSLWYKNKKCSFVYISMIYINGNVYYTRNLETFREFLDRYDTPNTINVIYVHNLGFDFTFLQNVIPFDTVFARTAHKPIFARYKSWEFRCSYFLSQMSLAKVGESYELPHGKLKDGLDYRKRRNTDTELTEIEEDYTELDVRVLAEYVQYELDRNDGKYKNIPYTQTGFVRRYILEQAKLEKEYYSLRNIVEKTKPDVSLFTVLENCFAGGYTHANFMAVSSGTYTHVRSYDFTSSYPAVMCRCKFPMTKFKQKVKHYFKYIDSEKYACVGKFRLVQLHAKTDLCYLSRHKVVKKSAVKCVCSNGRVFSAKSLDVYLTSVDIQTIRMMYNCIIIPLELYVSYADYLPRTIVNSILTLYSNKTRFKGVDDKKALYLASKQMINSVYGMSAFNPYSDDVTYLDGEWGIDAATPEKLNQYFDNRKTILPYQWGVFVTAWARNKLCNIAHKIGNDVLYMDTDSIKFIGDHTELFGQDNLKIHNENIQAAEHFKIDFSMYAPCDIKGKQHELGLWDYEGEYKSFKVLGAKRYCYTKYGTAEIFPVVAGCNIPALKAYLMTHNCNALLKEFSLNLKLDKFNSGKNTHFYHENYDIDIPVTDYTGHTKIEHIGYGVFIEPTTFDMSMSDDYLSFLCGYAVTDKRLLVRNGVMMD